MSTILSRNTKTKGKDQKFTYKYTDLAQIHEYLETINASYYQYIERLDGEDYIYTVPIINNEEKPARRGCRVVQAILIGNNNPAQIQGSALTYARRYSLLMAFGLATEDDDAQSLNNANQTKPVAQSKPKEKAVETVNKTETTAKKVPKVLFQTRYAELVKILLGDVNKFNSIMKLNFEVENQNDLIKIILNDYENVKKIVEKNA